MLFNSLSFMIFFPVVTLVFFILPKKVRYIWLLVASYYFYMSWNPKYAGLILAATVITYLAGLCLGNARIQASDLKKKLVVALCVILSLSILVLFKYFDFFLRNMNKILRVLDITLLDVRFDVLLPVGISFYTFQALSYVIDVYRGDTPVEKNFLRYSLFVSFFPQLVAGPIERSKNLLRQMDHTSDIRWDGKRVTDGLKIMVYGFFLKLVIADRVAILVNDIFENCSIYTSSALVFGAILFAVQIYCDFNSYSLIAIGSAKILGFDLMENFNTPYLANSVSDFWKRWHISLSTWFRDYLYIPLGGNRCSKLRNYLNIMIVFTVSGLWHGADGSFVVWGMINGAYQVIGSLLRPIKDKINIALGTKTGSFSYKLSQIATTFALVDFSWIFFRCDSFRMTMVYIKRMFTCLDPWNLFRYQEYFALSREEFSIALAAIAFMVCVDMIKYVKKKDLHEALASQCIWFRWGVYIMLIATILVFGIYGPGYVATEFIYFQF